MTVMSAPTVELQDRTCVVCPAQVLALGSFDVTDKPGRDYPYDRAAGYRVGPDGTPVCVHPFRVGVPAGRYRSAGTVLPREPAAAPAVAQQALQVPDCLDDLEGWLAAMLRTAAPHQMAGTLFRIERLAARRFDPRDVVTALRRVMSIELPG